MKHNLKLSLFVLACVAGGWFLSALPSQTQADEDEARANNRKTKTQVIKDADLRLKSREKDAKEARRKEVAGQIEAVENQIRAEIERLGQRLKKAESKKEADEIKDEIEQLEVKLELVKKEAARILRDHDDDNHKDDHGDHDHGDHDHGDHDHDHEHGHDEHGDHDHEHGHDDHDREFELHRHVQELQLHKAELEIRGAEFTLADRLAQVADEKYRVIAWGIRKAAQSMPPEEAIEFLDHMESKTRDQVAVKMIRMAVAELQEATGQKEQLKGSLEKLILGN
jgi:hypothetical protein